ncbi:class I SAM-dependent methyltransferase [Christiangramia sp. SM2212]|uniref:Class I SAM-dependent methyltransferase n=1 Tax=Christiangramia sediminicola TaxID=3073267 RepID=A0ABU1EP22_9FLAO|nr:class I SAM-dependent methyltransferase [Christiangramia sp. SM2212]MDR5590134.1 class I SAM-dependent methyltransferase [Christiangramia sp. SM2212]
MKDNFSGHSKDYAQYRPKYPPEIYNWLKQNLNGFETAWDCGTGNGQVAAELAEFFERVEATDISSNQIKQAIKKSNINYSVQPAEQTNFKNHQFDLIICAQAVHWFNFDKFYSEVKRCLKPDGLIVIMGYGLFRSVSEVNQIIQEFYDGIIGSYWDEERKYLDEEYKTIPFPFQSIKTPGFVRAYEWDIDHFLGYLRTWSAVKHYERQHGEDPVALVEDQLRKAFGDKNEINFPILFKVGKLEEADQ